MNGSIALSLIQNTAILLSFSMLYDYFWAKEEDSKGWVEKVAAGFFVGGIGIILMMTPWTLSSGVIFDTRTILLSITGLFFGVIPTLIGIIITSLYRISMGGDGIWMGLATIFSSGMIGLFWGIFRPAWRKGNSFIELLAMGMLVHLAMLACTFLLPEEHFKIIFKAIILPIFLIYSPGTMLLGILMLNRSANWKNKRALRDSQALYASLVDQMPAGLFRKTTEGRYEFVNEKFCELKGLTQSEIIGKTPQELLNYVDEKKATGAFLDRSRQFVLNTLGEEHHHRIMSNGLPIIVEEEYERANGEIEFSQVVKTPIFDADHRVIGSQGMFFDITFQKQLQAELIVAKDKAEDSDRLKTAFLHNISHEIRTPMNAIIGFSNLLNDKELSPENEKYYTEVIVESSNQLLSIIDDIVRIATIEAGQEKVNAAEFKLNDLCSMAYSQFIDNAKAVGIDLQMKTGLPDKEDWIFSDETKIFEVLTNLLVNALKFTRSGHIYFGYTLKGKELEFYVEDTGIGIEDKLQEDIFKRFRQADNTLGRPFGGSGLGLSICKAYIELLGGRMWLHSIIGSGSAFYFSLPYNKRENTKNDDVLIPSEDRLMGENGKKISVLVAEDEELNFLLLREILIPLDILVYRAFNGAQAIEIVKARKDIDLVLMDLKMPVMDGYESTILIRKEYPLLPVIALTAYSHDTDKDRAFACGCSDFLSKPFRRNDLIEKLRSHLNQLI